MTHLVPPGFGECCLQSDRGVTCPAWPAGSQTVAECRDPALGGGSAPVPAAVGCGILWILWMISADLLWVSLQGLSFWVFYSDRYGW